MAEELHPPVSNADHIRGKAGPGPVFTVYGDYECPDSQRLWRFLADARKSGATFQEVFRHFPLTRVHPHALMAAQAAEAADGRRVTAGPREVPDALSGYLRR